MVQRGFRRAERVSATVLRILSESLTRDIRDPRLGAVVFTKADMNDDLRIATVQFQLLGKQCSPESSEVREALAGLENAKGFFRRELGSGLQIKFTPDLRFYFDTSLTTIMRINEILEQVRPSDQ